ncbi:MAG: hypothetical protein LBL90_08720 [Prevotellaceae bacterium]|jgi:hypothetical protein|nr:hypothetical protein [Prevotellaceae bacterium]
MRTFKQVLINLLTAAFLVTTLSCGKENSKTDPEKTTEEEPIGTDDVGKYGCVIPENDSDPIIFTSVEDDVILIAYIDTITQTPSKVLIKKGENTFGIIFNNNVPIVAFSDDAYFLWGNYKDNSVSIVKFDKNSNFVSRTDYQNEIIAELTSLGSITAKSKSLNYGSTNSDFSRYFNKQIIKTVLLAAEAFVCGVYPTPLNCINAALDTFKAIADAIGNKNGYMDAVFLMKDFAMCINKFDYLCIASTANDAFSIYDDYFYVADDLSDNYWLEQYINDYIQMETHVENITENSADIINKIHFTECPYDYILGELTLSYRENGNNPVTSITVQTSEDGSKTKLDDLKANTSYEVFFSIAVSTNRSSPKTIDWARGNVVNFTTLEKTYAWQMAITYLGEQYTTDLYLDGYPNEMGGTAHLPGFKHQTMAWSNSWYNGLVLSTGYLDPSADNWNNNETNRCVTFYGRLPEDFKLQTFGRVELNGDCFYGDCYCGIDWNGTFAIVRVK